MFCTRNYVLWENCKTVGMDHIEQINSFRAVDPYGTCKTKLICEGTWSYFMFNFW
jgi:hypothetical protein